MGVVVPLTGPAPSAQVLVEVLAALGHPPGTDGPAAGTTLDLARRLVAVAERHAIAAELGADPATEVRTGAGPWDPDTDPDSAHDATTVRGFFERLALAHWRAERLSSTVEALRDAAYPDRPADLDDEDTDDADAEDDAEDADADDVWAEEEDPSGTAQLWDLAVHTTVCADAIISVLAGVVTPGAEITPVTVERLDAATALLVTAGRAAGRLREDLGLDDPYAGLEPLLGWYGTEEPRNGQWR